MTRLRDVLCPALVGILMAALISTTTAGQSTTDVTFKEQVQLPGVVLTAGVYHFTLSNDRRNVTIADANHRIVKTLRVIEVSRDQNGPRVTMRPSVDGAPPEVAALFSTGSTRGVEFVYTSKQ